MGEPMTLDGNHSGLQQPWLRWEGETARAFSAFEHYCKLGAARSCVKVGERLGISRQAVEKWQRRWNWTQRVLAFDHHQSRIVNRAVSAEMAQQAQKLLRKAADDWAALTTSGERLTAAEINLTLRTIQAMIEPGSNDHAGRNEFGFNLDTPPPPVFTRVMFSKPDNHAWVRRSADDYDATHAFHIPLEIVPRFREVFPCYPEHPDGFFVIA